MMSVEYVAYYLWIFTFYEYLIFWLESVFTYAVVPITIYLIMTFHILRKERKPKNVRRKSDLNQVIADSSKSKFGNEAHYESIDWLNQLMADIWKDHRQLETDVENYLRKLIPTQITLISFQLGSQPFRIEKIRARPPVASYSGVDFQISFQSSCYMLFEMWRFKTEIKNIKFRGNLIVLFKTRIHKSVKFYFLEEPELDFDAVGIFTIFKDVIKERILYFISSRLLLPYEIYYE